MDGGDLGLEEVVDESGCLEPLFYDEAEVVAEVTAKAERRRREAEEKAAEHARKVEECKRRNAANKAVLSRIREYDPKMGQVCYTRFYHKDFSKFDIDEESPLPPMRYTHTTPSTFINPSGKRVYSLWESANIFSVKIAASDVPFLLEVYGTVIARDNLDFKLSTVEVKFAVVVFAVESTFEIKVIKGNFCGEITACTSKIKDCLVLHDSKAGGVTSDGNGIIQLLRRVVCVGKKEKLLLTIATTSATRSVDFNPDVNGAVEVEITCGDVTMLIKVN
ncbi:hypothetical protein ACQ4PT_025672 [Festuca glaucescens]